MSQGMTTNPELFTERRICERAEREGADPTPSISAV